MSQAFILLATALVLPCATLTDRILDLVQTPGVLLQPRKALNRLTVHAGAANQASCFGASYRPWTGRTLWQPGALRAASFAAPLTDTLPSSCRNPTSANHAQQVISNTIRD